MAGTDGAGFCQGFSRVMSRPACRIRKFSKSHGSVRVGSEGFEMLRVGSGPGPGPVGAVRVGWGQKVLKSHGSGRVKKF